MVAYVLKFRSGEYLRSGGVYDSARAFQTLISAKNFVNRERLVGVRVVRCVRKGGKRVDARVLMSLELAPKLEKG